MTQELPEGAVTVLFTDVERSADLTARRADEAAQEILRAQREPACRQAETGSGPDARFPDALFGITSISLLCRKEAPDVRFV